MDAREKGRGSFGGGEEEEEKERGRKTRSPTSSRMRKCVKSSGRWMREEVVGYENKE